MAATVYFTLLLLLCASSLAEDLTEVTVTTDVGTFIGFTEQVDVGDRNVSIDKFLGIPFGEPPVGDLRFMKPVAKKPLKEPLKVQSFGYACLQWMIMFPLPDDRDSEDCLYLNVIRPGNSGDAAETSGDDSGKLPVMVWIYGGGFSTGKADHYPGDVLAANGPVIYVTLNYRVAAWGFLSTDDANAPGNAGLWDQHLGLQWIHDNIAAFGGDPQRVTIFGQSAGAASAIFQALYPGNKGLFQRIIPMSGTSTAHWAIRPNPKKDAEHLATLVGCGTDTVETMMVCLREIPAKNITEVLYEPSNWEFVMPMPFVPTVDGEFVVREPVDTLDITQNDGKELRELFSSYDMMIGSNSGEGGAAIHPFTGADTDAENFLPNKTFFAEVLVDLVVRSKYGDDVPRAIRDLVVDEYTDWSDPENPQAIRQQFCEMYRDSTMTADVHRTVQAHASLSGSNTFLYYFNVLLYKSIMTRPSWFTEALHGDDIILLLGNKFDMEVPGMMEKRDLQDWEKKAAYDMMTLWTNFAASGSPNKPRDLGVDWLPYTPSRHRYLELVNKVTSSKVKERLLERRAELWNRILPAIAKLGKCEKAKKDKDSTGTCSKDGDCPP